MERPDGGWPTAMRHGRLLIALLFGLAGVAGTIPAAAEGPAATSGTQRVLGRWLRPDGGYVLELHQTAPGGGVEALYFNPKPIHVGRAAVQEEGGAISVFVELRDVNYPGSTYTLWYDPKTDRLRGNYFQAMRREDYGVEFVRLR